MRARYLPFTLCREFARLFFHHALQTATLNMSGGAKSNRQECSWGSKADGSPLFDKHGENSRESKFNARANSNSTGGGGGTNANARGKIPRRFGQSKREKWEPCITIPGFYPSMPSRLIPYLAIYGTAESVCVEIYRRILKIERRRIGKGFVRSLEKKLCGGFNILNFKCELLCVCYIYV